MVNIHLELKFYNLSFFLNKGECMEKFQYLNYEDVNRKIEEIIAANNNLNQIKKERPIGYT